MTFSPAAPAVVTLDDRPARLVRAARDLANETGSAAFTVAQVAHRAGLSLKAFYRCFPGKDDLLIALLAEESRRGARLLGELIAGRADPLRGFVDEMFALATLPAAAGYAGVLVREHRRLVESRPSEIRAALAPMTDIIAAHVTTADRQRDAHTVLGVLLTGMHEVMLGRVDDTGELANYLYGFCADGLRGAR
jgi:AcrR family transcriptional regulator